MEFGLDVQGAEFGSGGLREFGAED